MTSGGAERTVTLTAFVGRPLEDVARLLSADAPTVISGSRNGGDGPLAVKLEVPLGTEAAVSRAAGVTLGPPEWDADEFRLPVAVCSLERPQWFPTFHGALEASGAGASDTRLRLTGTYELPLGALGRASGRAGADKLARASLYSLFVNIVVGTERQLTQAAPAWRPAQAGDMLRSDEDHPLGA